MTVSSAVLRVVEVVTVVTECDDSVAEPAPAVALLAGGSLIGGYLGARVALSVPATALRIVVVAVGLATVVKLLV